MDLPDMSDSVLCGHVAKVGGYTCTQPAGDHESHSDGNHVWQRGSFPERAKPVIPTTRTAWLFDPGFPEIKICPECASGALEGESSCLVCGAEPADDQTWRQVRASYVDGGRGVSLPEASDVDPREAEIDAGPDLVGCPFCGEEPYVHRPSFRGDGWQIGCQCFGEDGGAVWTNGRTFVEAAELWNGRVPNLTTAERRRAVAEILFRALKGSEGCERLDTERFLERVAESIVP